MRMLTVVAFLVLSGATFAEGHSRDMGDVASDAAKKPCEAAAFAAFRKKALTMFETWDSDHQAGSMKIFLDEKLLAAIPSIRAKKDANSAKHMRQIFFWLAMYPDRGEPIPSYLKRATPDVIADFDMLVREKNFDWNALADFAREMATQYEKQMSDD